MLNTIKDFIKKENLIEKNETVVIGLSGGIDSMVLFNCLYKLGYKIVVAHVHHNLRPESDEEYEFVKNYAKMHNVPFEFLKLEKLDSVNFEAVARKMRYDFFFEVAKKYSAKHIATAHHLDDLLETIIMRISRGSNLYGYGGIKPIIEYDDVSIIRPLLCVNKAQIEAYQKEFDIPFMLDKSNLSDDYTRNKYRHHVIPSLVSLNPNIYSNIMRYSKQMYQAFDFIRNISHNLYKEYDGKINNAKFLELDDAVKTDFISYILEQNEIECSFNKILLIKEMIENDKPNSFINLSTDYDFIKEYEYSYIGKMTNIDFEYKMNIGDEQSLPNGDTVKITRNLENNEEIYLKLCYNNIVWPITIRNRRDGDYFIFQFGKKKIKDLFIDMKIPVDIRNTVPVVLDETKNILGIPGIIKGPKDVIDPIYIVLKKVK